MNYILYDGPHRDSLLPFTFTRPVAGIRIGITTIREKWEHYLGKEMSHLTQDYLQEKFPLKKESENVVIDASILPNDDLVSQIKSLKIGQALVNEGRTVAVNTNLQRVNDNPFKSDFDQVQVEKRLTSLQHPWDIFKYNPEAINKDFKNLTSGRKSMPVSNHIWITGNPDMVFIEKGADVKYCIFQY